MVVAFFFMHEAVSFFKVAPTRYIFSGDWSSKFNHKLVPKNLANMQSSIKSHFCHSGRAGRPGMPGGRPGRGEGLGGWPGVSSFKPHLNSNFFFKVWYPWAWNRVFIPWLGFMQGEQYKFIPWNWVLLLTYSKEFWWVMMKKKQLLKNALKAM